MRYVPLSGIMDIIYDGEREEKLERVDFETAIHHAGYGKFQVWLLCVCGAIYATCAISTTTLSFVLPSAECDFALSSEAKGKLNATPLIGMCVGSYLWGNLADARGRKWAIIGALLLDAAAAILSSLAQSFPLFLACRFFSGFGIIGATGLIFPYFGDFLSLRHRDVMLCRLEVFWTLGTILLPAIAWAVIPQKWDIEAVNEVFSYNSWRVFVALCGVPSLLAAAFLAPFPESPRYLLAAGRPENALTVLRSIFAMNKGQHRDHYPVLSMILGDEEEQIPPAEDANANETKGAPGVVEGAEPRAVSSAPASGWRAGATLRWQKFWQRKKTLVATPYITMLALCCFVDFGLMFSYYTLMMWFPDLFERFGQFAALHPDESAGVCEVSSIVTEMSLSQTNVTTKCDRPIDARVFLYTLLVGLSCLPTSISVGLTINKLGKKLMLVLMLISSGLAALGLNFVHSSFQNLVLSCVFEAIISCTEAVLFCVICELFPTNVGATAMSVTVTFGRVGAIVGNVIFGALIDLNCYIPIYIFGFLLISSGLLCIVLPKHPQPSLN